MKKLSVIVIGAGNRGNCYAEQMHKLPEQYEIVGMADPQEVRRVHFQKNYGVPAENCYAGWEEILSLPKMADIALISTVDNMHYYPALKAIEQGYDLLLEKPVAPTAQECADIYNAARKKGVRVLVCHVLRYTAFFGRIKELLMEGTIGEVQSIDHVEGIGNVHFSHSYVRGNWHTIKTSAPMLLAKSCHDLDIIQWLLDKPCKQVSSFGSLTHFTPANAPKGAPARCSDGTCPVQDTCPYNCIKIYVNNKDNILREIITKGIAKNYVPTDEEVMLALQTTDYGRCVYHSDNDVLDHQVVNMEFEGGATANLSVNAFNRGGRYIRLYGTKGEIYAHMRDKEIQVYDFETQRTTMVPVVKTEETIKGGHGGGDSGIIREMYAYFSGEYQGFRAADLEVSVRNHIIGFAAEEARHSRTVVDVEEMLAKYGI